LATLLSLPHPEGFPPITLSPQKQKEKTQSAVVLWLVEEAETAAVLCVWEDLHWADPSTLEVLTLLLDQIPTTRMLPLLTSRPEFSSPWGSRSYLTHLTLTRLGSVYAREMAHHVIEQAARASTGSARTGALSLARPDSVRPELVEGCLTFPDALIEAVVTKTDGVPLFVEELTKSVIESGGTQPAAQFTIPATLQDSLMARLDRLGPAKEIAQLGATLGREFSYELLHAVANQDGGRLQRGLRQLVEAELLYQRGLPPQATYLFKHALIQDTAYQSLLKSRRQQLHEHIAQVLEAQFAETKETQPELLAHHYTEAGLIEQAIPYWEQAGQRASQRSAYVEAIHHLTKGLELLGTLPDTSERVQQELTLQLALSSALMTVKGYTAPEVGKIVLRVQELCREVGETSQLFSALYRQWTFYFLLGEWQTSLKLAKQMLRLSQNVQDQYQLSLAHSALGWTLYNRGELILARTHAEQTLALYDPQKHPLTAVNTLDPRVDCLTYATWVLWLLGYPDQALKKSDEARDLAAGLSHPFSMVYALGSAALLHLFRREKKRAQERAETIIALATEQGFPFWLAWGTMVQGWVLAEQDQVQEGIAKMRQMLSPFTFAQMAGAYNKVGQIDKGLNVLAEALARAGKTELRVHEAELYRLKGELTLQQENQKAKGKSQKAKVENDTQAEAEAEAWFLKAIEVSQKQQAKSLELRATMSLARLWQKQSKKAEARQILADVYNWFTEGFDTKDLQEAQALLDELAS
jgi:predicted ATPase